MMKTYIIIPVNELTESMIDKSINDINTLRLSVDGSRAILKFQCKYPDCVAGYTKYTNEEILEILATEEWTNDT